MTIKYCDGLKDNLELIKCLFVKNNESKQYAAGRIVNAILSKKGVAADDGFLTKDFDIGGRRLSLYVETINDLLERGVIYKGARPWVISYKVSTDAHAAIKAYKKKNNIK